jgi:hypothetical protein
MYNLPCIVPLPNSSIFKWDRVKILGVYYMYTCIY